MYNKKELLAIPALFFKKRIHFYKRPPSKNFLNVLKKLFSYLIRVFRLPLAKKL